MLLKESAAKPSLTGRGSNLVGCCANVLAVISHKATLPMHALSRRCILDNLWRQVRFNIRDVKQIAWSVVHRFGKEGSSRRSYFGQDRVPTCFPNVRRAAAGTHCRF